MPSSQTHLNTSGSSQSNHPGNGHSHGQSNITIPTNSKPPLPSKLPPPPPPPPKDQRPPLMAPTPPRNSNQYHGCQLNPNQNGGGGGSTPSSGGVVNNNIAPTFNNGPPPAISADPNANRSGHFRTNVVPPNQPNSFTRHRECGSKSSNSSHGSSSTHHHHHVGQNTINNIGNMNGHPSNLCPSSVHQPSHTHSSHSLQDSGIKMHGHDNCCDESALVSAMSKCQIQNGPLNIPPLRIPYIMSNGSNTMPTSSHTTISKNSLFQTGSSMSTGPNDIPKPHYCSIVDSNGKAQHPVQGVPYQSHVPNNQYPNHQYHQNLHGVQNSSGSSVSSSLQNGDQRPLITNGQGFPGRFHNVTSLHSSNGTLHPNVSISTINNHVNNSSNKTSKLYVGDCGTACPNHHHPRASKAGDQQLAVANQNNFHTCCGCKHPRDGSSNIHTTTLTSSSALMVVHHLPGSGDRSNNLSRNDQQDHDSHHQMNNNRQYQQCFGSPLNHEQPPVLVPTSHTHNLSNSSTTTHTSNAAIRQQPQFNKCGTPISSGRSSLSQYYDTYHYGPSSAASTSSANASHSSYHQIPLGQENHPIQAPKSVPPNDNGVRSNENPVPPPPPPPPPAHHPSTIIYATKSEPASPSHQMFLNSSHNLSGASSGHLSAQPQQIDQVNQQQQQGQVMQPLPPQPPPPPPPPPPPMPSLAANPHTLPPPASKPNPPPSCSTQMTTVRVSPNMQNQTNVQQHQVVTRVTSQAGVQNPLPSSDIPPPLPPLNASRAPQPQLQPLINKTQFNNNEENSLNGSTVANSSFDPNSSNTNLINLNYQRGGVITDAERKTEQLQRQVEQEIEQQQKSTDPLGICPKCNTKVLPAQEACKAMSQIFHASCFVCCECGRTLLGKTFYPVGDRVYCEEDFNYTGHMQSLERCAACSQPIFNMILPAMGKSYHPKCFKCCVCGQCLDGVPFTIDRRNKIYCVDDYHNIYSPKCAACGKTISPIDGTGETVRVVSKNRDYHIDCYCCEDCGAQLTDEEPNRNYPLDNHLLCQQCHIGRLGKMHAALGLD